MFKVAPISANGQLWTFKVAPMGQHWTYGATLDVQSCPMGPCGATLNVQSCPMGATLNVLGATLNVQCCPFWHENMCFFDNLRSLQIWLRYLKYAFPTCAQGFGEYQACIGERNLYTTFLPGSEVYLPKKERFFDSFTSPFTVELSFSRNHTTADYNNLNIFAIEIWNL